MWLSALGELLFFHETDLSQVSQPFLDDLFEPKLASGSLFSWEESHSSSVVHYIPQELVE